MPTPPPPSRRRAIASTILITAALVFGVGMLYRFTIQATATEAAAARPGDFEVRGISLAHLHRRGVGYGSDACCKQLDAIAAVGGNWVALTDFAFMAAVDRPDLRFGGDRSMTARDIAATVADAHARGIKVMIKPHIWSRDFGGEGGKWVGQVKMTNDADWDAWFKNYTAFALTQGRIAQESKADAFCIAVELEGTDAQEARWRKVIAEVRQVYTGFLTYACTSGDYGNVRWWDALDCIGIDAYFPLTGVERAGEADLRHGWSQVFRQLDILEAHFHKPICFTEIGYTTSARAGIEPWSGDVVRPDPAYQALLYRVALEEVARHNYMRGVFVWKWFTSDQWRNYEEYDPFSIQDSPMVLDVLKTKWNATADVAAKTR